MRIVILNEPKLNWFTTNKEVETHLTEAKIPYEKELIDNELNPIQINQEKYLRHKV